MRQSAAKRLTGLLSQTYATPAFAQLAARIGRAQAQRETRWLAEHCVETQRFDDLPKLVSQRLAGSPIQYLLGSVQFCGLHLKCKQPILIPRPETEQMVDWTLHTINRREPQWPDSIPFQQSYAVKPPLVSTFPSAPRGLRVLDLCTGSGNIALSLAAYLANARVTGVDINPEAVSLAQTNKVHNVSRLSPSTEVSFRQCDLMNDSQVSELVKDHRFDLIVSNPPYISITEKPTLQTEVVDFEDPRALFAPDSGLAFYTRIVNIAPLLLSVNIDTNLPQLVMEVGDNEQADKVGEMCESGGFAHVKVLIDWNGTKRWVAAAQLKRN